MVPAGGRSHANYYLELWSGAHRETQLGRPSSNPALSTSTCNHRSPRWFPRLRCYYWMRCQGMGSNPNGGIDRDRHAMHPMRGEREQ